MKTNAVKSKLIWLWLLGAIAVLVVGVQTGAAVPASSGPGQQLFYLPAILKSFTPFAWQEVGSGSASSDGISPNINLSMIASVAVAPDGTVYVAWQSEGGSNIEIHIRRWNGLTWEEVGAGSANEGGISQNNGLSLNPSVAIAGGVPYVAWTDDTSGNREIYVRRWNGSSWEEAGIGAAAGGGVSNNSGNSHGPALAVAPDQSLYLSWFDYSSGNAEVYVRRWNGSSWEEVGGGSAAGGGISNDNTDSLYSAIAIAPDGTPYVAWSDESDPGQEIFVRRWNGSTWEEVGPGSATGGGISNNSGDSLHPTAAVAPDGTPYIAWPDDTNGIRQIYVRRWSGANWEEVGPGSATAGGISNTSTDNHLPSMVITPGSTVYIAWQNETSSPEIYARNWQGAYWEEAGAGAATGGGISNNFGYSLYPSMAVAPDGTVYVAWHDSSDSSWDIYIRRRLPN